MTVRIRLKELMLEKSIETGKEVTQKDVAIGSGVGAGVLSRYINGYTTSINLDIAEKLCRYFDVGIGELLVIEEAEEERAS